MRFLILWLLITRVAVADVDSVAVYTLSTLPVTSSTSYREVLLDDGERILAELGIDLPGNQDEAQDVVLKRLSTPEGKALAERLGVGINGVMEAWTLGIDRLPAIVINEQFLIYGVYDLDKALSIYRSIKL